ncbi:hypothetical protein, unknown function [Leishmania tarentolae]|uniref:NUP-1 protein n=1 Tax=Leishmania tarentolae TaxID=5689 RepID=A0A640KJT4_LEITA|nr:hypothetical protein, unknown function [Leishmania tarentolae]
MWGNNFYKAGTHQQSSPCNEGHPIPISGPRAYLNSPSYAAQRAHPPPAGVLSADLARPISVRELAQSRVPAVPPPPPAIRTAQTRTTTTGFAGFGVPTSPVVYAATSGVSTSQSLSTHADAGDFTSLAHRDIDHLSSHELYDYASHLQESSKRCSGYLSEAYAKRDQYRGEVAHLKEELHRMYMQMDVLRREQERASETLLNLREDNTQLRQKLAEAEGKACQMQAKMSVLSGADPSIALHFYQSQLALKEAQLRELQQEHEKATVASLQRRSCSTTAAEHDRRSGNISGEGAAAPHTSPPSDLRSKGELQDGAEAASADLHTALGELQCLNTSLSHRLEEAHTSHKAALAAHAEESAAATADRAVLLDTIAQLRQQCADMQSTEDQLVAALTQRAPISKKEYSALQASYDDLTAALAKAEAQVAALQEKEKHYHQSAQQAQEELHESLTTGLEERQVMQARNEQMQSLVNHLQRELELAERANQLRQEQLDAAISGNQQLAENFHTAQEQLLSASAELQDLCDTRERLESQLRELQQRMQELEQGDPHQRRPYRDEETDSALPHTSPASTESAVAHQRQELEAELETLRSQRDALVCDRDGIIGEVRRLQEERLALLRSPRPQVEAHTQTPSSAVEALLEDRADDDLPQQGELSALEAAHHCIEKMKHTIEALQAERVRVETDLTTEVNTLEAELTSQPRALAEAEVTAAAQNAHLDEIMMALRDELVATQAQKKRLRASEETHRERYAEQQRVVEQLPAHVRELEMAARHAEGSLPIVPSAQPATVSDSQQSIVDAALESLARQLEDAQHRFDELTAEHARTVEELVRATRAVAELEARAADVESKRETTHAAAESAEAGLAARVAELTKENAQLKEKLSTSRAAVTTFASRQTGGESASASLEERCAAEVRRTEIAEAEVSALREALSRTAAELAEVLQRSEDVQATLERTVARLGEQESLVETLSAESTRLQGELATVQGSVLLLANERDALAKEMAELQGNLSAAEDRASGAAAAQQRLQGLLEEAEAAARSKDVELSTAFAALDRTASEVCEAERRLQAQLEAKEQLTAEHARTVEELARATRAVAELEARAADVESKRETTHAAAESAEAGLAARVAELTKENAQLKEKLSTSRAAVTTFASRQTDGESASASLEERCAAEVRRTEIAEAEVSALREALSRTAAELAEVLQRSEDVQATLERTVARLGEQESLVETLSAESTRLQGELATVQGSVLLLANERDALAKEMAELQGNLSAAEDRASGAAAAQQRLQGLLEEAEAAARSKDVELSTAFAALDRTASEVCEAERRLQAQLEAKEQLTAEHARTVEELARATRAVAELEARAADVESKRETTHAAAESAEAGLAARVAELTKENAQLKEKLSTSRAAVTTFASRQTDGESASASLEERCAAEVRRTEIAEAEVSALREALSRTAAELAEVLQRSEDVQATLERTVARLGEQESLVETLSAESTRLQGELATVQGSVLLLANERDALAKEMAELQGNLSAAEDRASGAAAAQQRLQGLLEEAEAAARSKDVELSTAFAALDRTASEVCEAERRLQAQLEAKEQLTAEHARTVEELARATRAVAELEARAADVESKRETTHAAAESAEAGLAARVAELTKENAQLKEKLSTSRAAVTTFASRQTDGESASASLEERCAAEVRRTEIAEAEVSALREALSRTAAELAEVLQRSEDVQATLERTVARLGEQESLVETLSAESTRLQGELATVQGSVLLLANERDALAKEMAELQGNLSAAEDRASGAAAAQQRLQGLLEEAEAAARSKDVELSTAFAALDRTASEVCEAERRLQAQLEAKEQLTAEHARTVEELARATRAVAELEARAADVESKRETTHAAAESAEAGLAARVAELTKENAQLKEKLSTSRAAVTTFASRQTDGESASASLEERCAAEVRRTEIAEAEVSALREALSRTAAELAEVLQRSEDVQATLERTVARLGEQESLVETLSAESTRLQGELATVQGSVLLLANERDALAKEMAELQGNLSAAEDRASGAAAAQQRLQGLLEEAEAAARSKDVELSTAFAALDRTASEVCEAERRLQAQLEAKEQLTAEHARTVEELARATRAVAELEARAADVESKRETTHAAAESAEAGLAARVAELTKENAQLKEKLSTSRAAVTTFASRQTDGESASASLEERCAAEVRRTEIAEAEVSALREALSRTAAELAEVLQRSEDVQATLERTVARLGEQESLVETLSAESTRLQGELATVQGSVLLLANERDALAKEMAELQGNLSAAEDRASGAAAAQQRLQGLLEEAEAAARSKDVELSTAFAALDRTASEVCEAERRLQAQLEAKEQLTAEHARTVEELARATRAVAELEARAADVESKRETTHAAAESAEAGLAARVAELTKENAQLKEKLSTSRAAVTTFASRQTDGESASASLEERCAAEVRRTEIAEAEVSALREALSRTAAELAEVLQRSEDVQATLERTVARLGEQESLVEQLNHDASELNEARLVLLDEVTQLKKALAEVVTEKADVLGQLLATQKELDRAAEVQDAQCREEERLQDALSTAMAAFERQTQYVRLGMAHVVDMSRAFCRVAEEAVRLSSAQTNNASGTGTSVREILSPWTLALQWVSAMEQRLEALDIGGTPNSVSDAEGQGERRRRRRRSRTTEAKEDDGEEVGEGSGADAPSVSLCLAVPASRAEAAFSRLIDDQGVATKTIGDLRCALAGKELDLANLRSAMDALAKDLMNERDRADNLSAAIDDASEKIASAQAEFEEQLRQRTAATTAEVVEARRAEARATAAQVRAEKQLAAVENDLKEQDALLRRLQDENHRLTREADQLLRSLRLEGNLRISRNASGSVTPKSVSLPAKSAEDAVQLFTTASSTVEAVEQAQILQVSSLQADLMLTRRQARELEGRETTLRQACAAQEQQLNELRVQAAEAEHLREDLATLRADYAGLEQRYNDLERMSTAVGGGAMQELKQLRQQLKVREAELEELKARMRDLMLSKAAPELEAARRQEALRESLSGITTQLAATQAQYGGGTDSSNKARSRRTSLAAAPSNADFFPSLRPSPQDVLTSRIEHLETLVHDREVALEKVQAAQLASRAAMDTLEDQLATKTAALERAESLVAEYEDTIDKLTRDAVVRCSNRNTVPTTAPPLSSALDIHDAEALSASVPPLTPLTPRTRAAINRQPHAAISMASPAPRMPNLEEVADDKDDSEEGKHVDSVGSSSRAAPSSVTDGEARASGSRRRATSLTAHRSSPSTKRNVSSSLSNAPGESRCPVPPLRPLLGRGLAPASTRKPKRHLLVQATPQQSLREDGRAPATWRQC